MKEERFLHPGKPAHQQGDCLGQKKSFRASEENTAARVEGELYRWSVLPRCTPQLETLIHQYGWGLGDGTQALEIRPSEKTGVDYTEMACED